MIRKDVISTSPRAAIPVEQMDTTELHHGGTTTTTTTTTAAAAAAAAAATTTATTTAATSTTTVLQQEESPAAPLPPIVQSHKIDKPTSAEGQHRQKPRSPATMHQMEHFNRIKELVKKAIAAHHTFMIHGRSRVVRECLLNRGWCEKFHKKGTNPYTIGPSSEPALSIDSNPAALLAGVGSLSERQNERVLISKMLGNHTVDFLWNAGSEWTGWPSQDNKTTIFNRFTRANFTSKVGLCSNVRQMHWYYEAGIANTLFPRCYNISQPDQMHAFIEDFRLTACLSLLKWLVDRAKTGEDAIRSSNGCVPLRALDFAIGRCTDFIASKSHEDIDQEFEKVWSHQWEQFITWYYKLLHGNAQFVNNNSPIHKYLLAARHLLKKMKKFWPQLDMDGTLNVWILKPGNKSRGRGIVLMNKLDDILAKVNPTNKTTDTRFVIQKYIERPLLIYETKFDIRQWFLVTNAQPLTLWMYRESYLRFCSQKFSLTNFHESIHLSNNAVQCKYKNSPDRDSALPDENMWDVATFKEYLRSRGDESAWEELIYPGMKQGLVGSLLASQEAMDRRKNSFELYGADFMVMEDFSVWLIEINSHPDMSNSTSVTTRLCRKAMEDTIKVVIDYRENSNADTGDFELVYKQKLSSCQAYLGSGLSLHGTRIALGERRSNTGGTGPLATLGKRKLTVMPSSATAATVSVASPPIGQNYQRERVGPVLVDLIEELEIQLDREFYEYMKLRSSSGLSRKFFPLGMPMRECLEENRKQTLFDAETNTFPRNINLLLSTSHTNLKSSNVASAQGTLRNTTGKISKSNMKPSPIKKIGKQKANSGRNSDRIREKSDREEMVSQQEAKTLMSKIIDLQKETTKNKSASSRKSTKLYRNTKLAENSVLNNAGLDLDDTSPTRGLKKLQDINNKIIPSMPSVLLPSGHKQDMKSSRLALEGNKPGSVKRRNRAISSQVFVDVTDMYAVGLAVNK